MCWGGCSQEGVSLRHSSALGKVVQNSISPGTSNTFCYKTPWGKGLPGIAMAAGCLWLPYAADAGCWRSCQALGAWHLGSSLHRRGSLTSESLELRRKTSYFYKISLAPSTDKA